MPKAAVATAAPAAKGKGKATKRAASNNAEAAPPARRPKQEPKQEEVQEDDEDVDMGPVNDLSQVPDSLVAHVMKLLAEPRWGYAKRYGAYEELYAHAHLKKPIDFDWVITKELGGSDPAHVARAAEAIRTWTANEFRYLYDDWLPLLTPATMLAYFGHDWVQIRAGASENEREQYHATKPASYTDDDGRTVQVELGLKLGTFIERAMSADDEDDNRGNPYCREWKSHASILFDIREGQYPFGLDPKKRCIKTWELRGAFPWTA